MKRGEGASAPQRSQPLWRPIYSTATIAADRRPRPWTDAERSIPFQRSLFPFIDKTNCQDREKNHHRPKAEGPGVAESHGPRKQKRELKIENDEKQRHQIKAHVEFHSSVVKSVEAAFIN